MQITDYAHTVVIDININSLNFYIMYTKKESHQHLLTLFFILLLQEKQSISHVK